MLVFLIILLIASAIGAIVAFKYRNSDDFDEKMVANIGKWASPICFSLAIVIVIVSGVFTVKAGTVGVITRFDKVTGEYKEQGLNFKTPLIDSVKVMDIQTQKYEVMASAASMDMQKTTTQVAVNYKLNPSAAPQVFETLGTDYVERVIAPAVQETVKAVTARYIAEDLILQRDVVKNDVETRLTSRLSERGLIVEAVSMTEFDFSDVFNEAIGSKVAAEQDIQKARNQLERIKIEAQQTEARALGMADARRAEA